MVALYRARIEDRIALYCLLLDAHLTPRIMLSVPSLITQIPLMFIIQVSRCPRVGSSFSRSFCFLLSLSLYRPHAIPQFCDHCVGSDPGLNPYSFGEKMSLNLRWSAVVGSTLVALFILTHWTRVSALDWVPTDQEMAKYRESWNPPTHGTTFTSSADVARQGQWYVRAYVQGMIGSGEFQTTANSKSVASPFSPDAVMPAAILYYGLTRHVLAGVGVSAVYWHSDTPEADGRTSGSGIGTTNLILKYRPVVQDPDSWKPSVALYSKLSLPTNHWFGTPEIPGGFTPLSRVPSSRFNAVALTEGILFRKNLEPFRITGNVFTRTISRDGSEPGITVYGGDLINTHLALEHVLNERTGFGYLVEMTTLQQLASRLDGRPVNTTPASFWLVGIQPGLEYTFSRYESGARLVGAIGVMFTVAGQDDIRAIYPNISFKYFFEQN